jgi:co-chaperonin GroES (HSP10)
MINQGFILPTKVLIKKQEEPEKKTASGITILSTKTPQISGLVIKTGAGTEAVPMCVKEGQTIFFYERVAQPLKLFEEDYLLLDVREVLFCC